MRAITSPRPGSRLRSWRVRKLPAPSSSHVADGEGRLPCAAYVALGAGHQRFGLAPRLGPRPQSMPTTAAPPPCR
jgi:hypothetical protein